MIKKLLILLLVSAINAKKILKPVDYDLASYHSIKEINDYLHVMEETYPTLCKVTDIGKSFENRTIYAIQIGLRNRTKDIWVDGGMHAREWASIHSAVFLIQRLIDTPTMLWSHSYFIAPLMNPDGYEETMRGGNKRQWRKNMNTNNCTPPADMYSCCPGVDLNRNFDVSWGTVELNTHKCTEFYRGASAFSEPETRAIRDFVKSHSLKGFLTLHTYGQMVLIPYSDGRKAPTFDKLKSVARLISQEMHSVDNKTFITGTVEQMFHMRAGGGSSDWAYQEGVPLAFGIELRPRGYWGFMGFRLPSRELPLAGEEAFKAVQVLTNEVDKL